MKWANESGIHLLQALNGPGQSGLNGIIPATPGIYMWKLQVNTHEMQQCNEWDSFIDLLKQRCNTILGEDIPNAGNWVTYKGTELRGKKLPESKEKTLRGLGNHQQQQYTRRFLSTLDIHAPALYVGESSNLRTRVKEHLRGETGFAERLKDTGEIAFENLQFWYLEIEEENFGRIFHDQDKTTIRKTFEYVTTMASIGAFTNRAG